VTENNLDLVVLPTAVGIPDAVLSSFVPEMINISRVLRKNVGQDKEVTHCPAGT